MTQIASLKFILDCPEYAHQQPYELYGFPDIEPSARTNCKFHMMNVNVRSIREKEQDFKISDAGFQILHHRSQLQLSAEQFESGPDAQALAEKYMTEMMQVVQSELHALKVFCIDWRLRRNQTVANDAKPARDRASNVASIVHCDYSFDGGQDRLHIHLAASELSEAQSRAFTVVIVNAWRPLRTVQNAPLVVCDRRSVKCGDVIEVDKVLADKVEKGLYAFHKDYHQWYWLPDQTPDEVIIFVSWLDRSQNGTDSVSSVPHAAWLQATTHGQPRESIELRFIIFVPQGL
ncbi:hypothetical protein B0O99DRAFT_46141 [Bisporella sp. PMI_857]|nr:hypothetical protein B0O99DRAFT_46141 [Bisporella sp. PMI_857]